jgi:hypothetical protein
MIEPSRWSEEDSAPPELRALLRGAHGARPLDRVVRDRTHTRVARAAALPIGAAGWLSVKTALAAFGVSCGTAVVAVLVTTPRPASLVAKAQPGVTAAWHQAAPSGPRPPPVVAPARSAQDPAPSSPSAAAPSSVAMFPRQQTAAPPTSATGLPALASTSAPPEGASALTAESELLERARSALRRSPVEALRLAGEHAERFPHAQLGSERMLIQIEALHRLGRDSEAQSIAQALLARSPDDLYVERVRKLLGELE